MAQSSSLHHSALEAEREDPMLLELFHLALVIAEAHIETKFLCQQSCLEMFSQMHPIGFTSLLGASQSSQVPIMFCLHKYLPPRFT